MRAKVITSAARTRQRRRALRQEMARVAEFVERGDAPGAGVSVVLRSWRMAIAAALRAAIERDTPVEQKRLPGQSGRTATT
jgi:hypothetical protein